MLKIAICEDEKQQQDIIETYIHKYIGDENFKIQKVDSGEKLIELYENGKKYPIIFLDMKMGNLDGIETANKIHEYDSNAIIIIITSIIEYAIEGYSVNAFDFMLKPIEEKKFYDILKKAVSTVKYNKNKIYEIKARSNGQILKIKNIIYIESNRKKTIVHTKKDRYENNENISEITDKLSDKNFIRISRFYLVNLQYFKKIHPSSIELISGKKLKYSKTLKEKITNEYINFMMGDS